MHNSGSRIVVTATIIYTTASTSTTHSATSIGTITSDSSNARTAIITANDSAKRHGTQTTKQVFGARSRSTAGCVTRQLTRQLDVSLDSWDCINRPSLRGLIWERMTCMSSDSVVVIMSEPTSACIDIP